MQPNKKQMEAKELRIGNFISCNSEVMKVAKITLEDVGLIGDDGFMYISDVIENLDNFKPIPLTEDWLLKFDFEFCEIVTNENITVFPSIKNTFHLYHKDVDNEWFDISVNTRVNKIYTKHTLEDIEIKHVHQLQNLYFALTGEELSC